MYLLMCTVITVCLILSCFVIYMLMFLFFAQVIKWWNMSYLGCCRYSQFIFQDLLTPQMMSLFLHILTCLLGVGNFQLKGICKLTAGKSNDPSSSTVMQSHQILWCVYNANGTVFVIRKINLNPRHEDFKVGQHY